jgi:hypothetical protein
MVTRLPIRTGGLNVTILYDEPRVLLILHSHRLAPISMTKKRTGGAR